MVSRPGMIVALAVSTKDQANHFIQQIFMTVQIDLSLVEHRDQSLSIRATEVDRILQRGVQAEVGRANRIAPSLRTRYLRTFGVRRLNK